MLRCLVVTITYTDSLSIEVEENDTVVDLKNKIRAHDDCPFNENGEFTLWEINLPKKEFQDVVGDIRTHTPFNTTIKKVLGGTELDNSVLTMKDIFPKGFTKGHFHIAIQLHHVTNDSVYVFVDDSNLFIQGKYAVGEKEELGCITMDRGYELNEFRIEHTMLLDVILNGRTKGSKPMLVGSRPPSDESLWDFIREREYDVDALDRNVYKREKGVDATLGCNIDTTVLTRAPGVIVLVAGDANYLPHIRFALDHNWKVEVWYWRKGASRTLGSESMVEFYPLEDYYKSFSYGAGQPTLESKSKLEFITLYGEKIKEWGNKNVFKCFDALDLFTWFRWEDDYTVHLYFKKKEFCRAKRWLEDKYDDQNQIMVLAQNESRVAF